MFIKDVLSLAWAEVGVKESPPGSNNVKYNDWFYGKSVSGAAYPWCAVFISWLFRAKLELCIKTASCQSLLSWFESYGKIVKNPKPGDIVFFKYNTNNRRTNHVGIVVDAMGSVIKTIEGNTGINSNDNGGCVMERVRSSNIVAFARPKYEDAEIEFKVLKRGSKGADVRELQTLLVEKEYLRNKSEIDGIFGKNTEGAVRLFQLNNAISDTGIVDEYAWNMLDSGSKV